MHNRGGCRSQWSHHRRPSELSKSVGASQSDASDTHVRRPPRRATCAPISGTQRLPQGHITHRGIPNARVPGYYPKRSHASLDKGPVATNAPSHPASSAAARCPSPRPVPAPAPAKLARLAASTDRKAGPEAPRPTHGRATATRINAPSANEASASSASATSEEVDETERTIAVEGSGRGVRIGGGGRGV